MHFLEAHTIVHEFAGALGKNHKYMFIPYSWVNHGEQELIDAFIIFFGHMVLWHTRTNKELDRYMEILMFITFVIPDDLFELIEDSEDVMEKAKRNVLYKIINKSRVENANKVAKIKYRLTKEAIAAYKQRIETIDYGKIIDEFQGYIFKYRNEPEETKKEFDLFMDDYIALVYSKTSFKEPKDEDYSCFCSFDYMREMLDHFDDLAPVAKRVLGAYKGYICNNR